jgi:alginate O-acetyltransferase complex protein AlgI
VIFTTYWFQLFALVAVAIYWLLPWSHARKGFLGLACLAFHYHFAGPAGMAPIIVLMIATYLAALSRSRAAATAAIVLCVGALCSYKYALFLIGAAVGPFSASAAAGLAAAASRALPALPPLGISFFVFEFVHYLVEVRRGGEPIRNPLRFLLFAIFFPSLVAGPIKRYPQFLSSLDEGCRTFRVSNLGEGLLRIATGYFKKVVVADNLSLYIDRTAPGFSQLPYAQRWEFLAAVAFRILMDFSGYSDIAIGAARLLGIRLPENFDWPYLATNIRDFWQRWHISLSTWVRDYVYIPLGGSRHGLPRRVLNGFLAFALIGLWHGPAWGFALWGLYHGLGLAASSTYTKVPLLGPAAAWAFAKEPLAALALTQLFVWLGWLLFFYPVHTAIDMASGLLSP